MSHPRRLLVLAAMAIGLSMLIAGAFGAVTRTQADDITASPGPLAAVRPVPCLAGVMPAHIDFRLSSAPQGRVPAFRSVSRKGRILRLYEALCGVPPLDFDQVQCVPNSHKVEYIVRAWRQHKVILQMNLDLGHCQLAWVFWHGYSLTYRTPNRVVTLIAKALGVRAGRLMPLASN